MSEELFQKMATSIIDGDSDAAVSLATQSISAGIDPLDAITKGFVVGVNTVGAAFGRGDAFLPELVMAGEAMKAAVATLDPEMKKRGTERKMLGKVVIATVEGDIHEIGKSLVATMLAANGFEVHDLGVDVPIDKFVGTVKQTGANLVGLSSLLTTTMVMQRKVIEALADAGMRKQVKVMVGGAPVSRKWAEEIGADGYAEDAVDAVDLAMRLASR